MYVQFNLFLFYLWLGWLCCFVFFFSTVDAVARLWRSKSSTLFVWVSALAEGGGRGGAEAATRFHDKYLDLG